LEKHEFYWKFFERPKRLIKKFFRGNKSNAKIIQREADKYRGEIMLDNFRTVRLLGWTDQYDEDYYWVIDQWPREIKLSSCVGGFIRLKNRLSKFEYYNLDNLWNLNQSSYEEGLERVKVKKIIIK